jgi:dihydroorotate dehydrogenase (fumarate)
MTVDLSTEYLGLKLKNPVVIAACPLTQPLDSLRKLQDAGAAAVVFPSLFEEQIEHDQLEMARVHDFGTDSFAEALSYFPEPQQYRFDTETYLESIAAAKKALAIPVIGSLNGVSDGGWVRYAKLIQEAGADALELNVYFIPADVDLSGEAVEARYLELVSSIKKSISIPLAVKVGPNFSSPANMAKRLVEAGADGLVLFNRFLQPQIDLEELKVEPRLVLSTSSELLVPLRWTAVLRGRTKASLALTSGIHEADDLLQALLAGADVGMIASVLYKKGFAQIGKLLGGVSKWMEEKEYQSVAQLKGSMSLANCPDPSAFSRGNYMKTLTSFTGQPI